MSAPGQIKPRLLAAAMLALTALAPPASAQPEPATIGPSPASSQQPDSRPERADQTGLQAATPRSAPALGSLPLPVIRAGQGVIVRAEAGLEPLADTAAEDAPSVLTAIRNDLGGLPFPAHIDIRLVKRARDLGLAAPKGRGAPEWASGVAYLDTGVVVVATRSGSQSIDVQNVVRHELAHVALDAALSSRAPRWLNEGFAYLHAPDWSPDRVQLLTGMVWFDGIIPLQKLNQAFTSEESQINRAYAQSYDFVAFLARRGRYADPHDDGNRWPFRRFLANIAAGRTVSQAAGDAYGTSLLALHGEWRANLRDRYLLMPAGLFALSVWVFASILLMIGFIRRRTINRRTLARWQDEEAGISARAAISIDIPRG